MSLGLSRLPALDLIRGFVAVGRRMSITLAAEDLCLTQSAVSRQIHTLEDALGFKLLTRGHRSISFTPEGEHLFRTADIVIHQLQDVLGTLLSPKGRKSVTLTSSIGVAGLWLLPRLGRFQQSHPDIDVRIAANNRIIDLKSEGMDLAVRYCPSSNAPPGATRLFGETIVPVAHPSLGIAELRSPKTIEDNFLIEFDDPRRPWLQWNEWLNASGFHDVKPRGVLRYNQYDLVIQAAVAGQGLALGRLELIKSLLRENRLLQITTPIGNPDTDYAYWLVLADESPRDAVRKVAAWILAEADRVRSELI